MSLNRPFGLTVYSFVRCRHSETWDVVPQRLKIFSFVFGTFYFTVVFLFDLDKNYPLSPCN